MSKLWKDIISLGGKSVNLRDMLVKGFRWEVGSGCSVGFWWENWVGAKVLQDSCPRLYAFALNKDGLVSEMGLWEGDRWRWNMEWRRERFGREKDEEEALWRVLGSSHLKKGRRDVWAWVHDPGGKYTVRAAYDFLVSKECLLDTQICKFIWCRVVPSKVGFFGWRLCLDRLPTKWNLEKRGVCLQQEDLLCSLCNEVVEEVDHLFCTCRETWLVWGKVLRWLGIETVLINNVHGDSTIFLA
ncbi:hypothetical protein SLA2020_000070 [Shorea laevis]